MRLQSTITKAIQDPQFMAYLLRKQPKFIDKKANTRIKAYLIQQGLLDTEKETRTESTEFMNDQAMVEFMMDQEEQPTNP